MATPVLNRGRAAEGGGASAAQARHRTARRRPPLLLVAASVVTALVATLPLWYLAVRAVEGIDRAGQILGRPRMAELIGTSVALALVVAVSTMIIGVAAAWLVARTALPARRTWAVLLVLPLAVPSYVAAYSWVSIWPGVNGFGAAAVVLTLATFPYVTLPVLAVLARGEASLEEVSRSLGGSGWTVFRTVTLPVVWPAAVAGGLLAALYTLSDFGAVSILRVDVLTRSIYASYASSFDRTAAVVQALVLVAAATVLVIGEQAARGRAARWNVGSGVDRAAALHPPNRRTRVVATVGLAGVVGLALGVPAIALTSRLLQGMRGGLDIPALLEALVNTAGLAAAGAMLAVALALPVAVLTARYAGHLVRSIELATFAGHALPGVVVGLSLVFVTLTVLPAAYQTAGALAVAYAVLFLPKAIGSARTAVAGVSPNLDDVARTHGRGPLAAFLTVTGRVAAPGVVAGGLLVMVTAMKELPATLMLRPTGMETLATEMWTKTAVSAYGAAAPYAAALVLLAAVPTLLLARGVRIPRSSSSHATVVP